MLWPTFDQSWWSLEPFSELRRLQRHLGRLERFFDEDGRPGASEFPVVNVWKGQDDTIVTAELPGVDPKTLDITVRGNTLVIQGSREPQELKEGETYHRRERGFGKFFRSLELPHKMDVDNVEAQYINGILQVRVPWKEEEKPRQISVQTA